MQKQIEVFDTTLRDGAQGEGISFSVQDKLAVARALDELGAAWIEAGNPGSNPKDMEFFRLAKELRLERSKLCAFGSTRKKQLKASEDGQVKNLLTAETEGVVIFGKSWDLHVTEVLRVSPEENIDMIAETIFFLKEKGRVVIYDAEHFFDGWLANPAYAISTLKAAREAGADRLVLCDTNGGTFPDTIAAAVKDALAALGGAGPSVLLGGEDLSGPAEGGSVRLAPGQRPSAIGVLQSKTLKPNRSEAGAGGEASPLLGIHAHNDADMASANTVAAVMAGCAHVQGTLVGFGERCGNTSLAAVIPSLELKLGLECLPAGRLSMISTLTRKVAEIANVALAGNMPYVGAHAFAHKAGMHADGILKVRRSFEHIDPALVGNDRHFLMSEVGGRSAIAERAKAVEPSITREHPVTLALAEKMKALEAEGWAFEGADASFELMVRRELGRYKPLFAIDAYRVVSEHPTGETLACSHAWVKVLVDGRHEIAAAEGDGPVNAMDGALRRALKYFYPDLEQVRLSDYKVRVIDGNEATAAKVRVLITSSDGSGSWSTVGVSGDIIDASRAALVDSIEYKLISDIERRFKAYL